MQLGATVSLAEIPDEAVSEGVCMRLGLSRARPPGRVVNLIQGDKDQVFVYLSLSEGQRGTDFSLILFLSVSLTITSLPPFL